MPCTTKTVPVSWATARGARPAGVAAGAGGGRGARGGGRGDAVHDEGGAGVLGHREGGEAHGDRCGEQRCTESHGGATHGRPFGGRGERIGEPVPTGPGRSPPPDTETSQGRPPPSGTAPLG